MSCMDNDTPHLPNYLLKLDASEYVRKGSDNIRLYGIGSIIKDIYGNLMTFKVQKEIFKDTRPRQTYFNWTHNVSGIAIQDLYHLCSYWKKTCKKTEEEFNNLWDNIYLSAHYFGCTNGKQIRLPKKLDNKLAYLLGVIMGDGHLAFPDKSYDKRTTYNSELKITDGHKQTFIKLSIIFQDLFDYTPKIYSEVSKINKRFYRFVIKSKPLHRFLMAVCRIPTGNKFSKMDIPDIIKNSSLEIQKSFIIGFFDADGHLRLQRGKYPLAVLSQKNKNILFSIMALSKRFDLEWKGPYRVCSRGDKISYAIRISSIKQIKTFLKHLTPLNPIKLRQCEELWKRIKHLEPH